MIQPQWLESGPYFSDFSLHISGMRVKIGKNLCSLSCRFAIEHLSPSGCWHILQSRESLARQDFHEFERRSGCQSGQNPL